MSLVEVIVASAMLAAFTGVFVMVTNFTARFFKGVSDTESARGVLIDHHELLMSFDNLAETLSQPGFKKDEILQLKCAFPPNPPKLIWDLPGLEGQSLPGEYKICIFPTKIQESNIDDLALGKEDAQPGIYILYASPLKDRISITAVPIRRIFCRPKPYCI